MPSSDEMNDATGAGGLETDQSEQEEEEYRHDCEYEGSDPSPLSSGAEDPSPILRQQDIYMPIAGIAKLMKKTLPDHGKIALVSRECVQECVSEFISFVTSEAADISKEEKRGTIQGGDILNALAKLGFDNYTEPLKIYLLKYREANKVESPDEGADEAGTAEAEDDHVGEEV